MNSKNKIIDEAILDVVHHNTIHEQSELIKHLKKKGIAAPQATISRHLQKLKIAKVNGAYKVFAPYRSNPHEVLNMQFSDSGMIVLLTHPGNANSIAYIIDSKFVSYNQNKPTPSGIIATIAGDDTVLVILKNKKYLKSAIQAIKNELDE